MMSTDTDVEDSNATIQCADAEEHPSDAQPGTSDDRPQRQRLRKLTLPAQEEYNARVNKYNHDLSIVTGEIDAAISHIDNFQHDKSSLGSLQKLILSCQESYDDLSEKFVDYLKSMRTVESSDEEGRHSRIRYRYGLKVDLAYSRIKMLLKPAPVVHALGDTQFSNTREPLEKTFPSDNRSVHSASSASSSKSSIMGRKLAKLEAAIVRKQYLEKETELIRKKAELEAQMKLLDVERNIETRRTELEAMNRQGSPKPPSEITDSHSRTQEYVNALPLSSLNGDGVQQHGGELQLDPNAPVFQPQQPCVPLTNQLNDMTKFLLKKDMILARITAYDDNPSSYLTWKQTFKSLMRELSATPAEELDLLIRWLGTESKQQAATIRRCNADDPVKAVKLIWERMEERFGAPELIESFLKRQIASFPKIGYRDYKKLYGLADLAAEIASVKKQPQYSTLFGYFDSPTGINLLVAKLPNNLQDKWTTEASKYKNREHVVFPPFSFFLTFIKNMAKMKNDPSFNFEPEKERPLTAPRTRNQGVVQVRKTETTDSDKVKPFLSNDGSKSETTGENDKSPRCPVHHTRHLLNDCKGFRAKTLAERKTFIFSNGICIKCCGPKKHRAKNCTTSVECGICKRTSHPTALHVDESKPEGEIVQSSCTQVCGTQYGASKSCAKIVPVRVYPDGSKQKSRIIYAMIDDQSNHCLASTSFFDAFNITGPEYEYTLISCSGTVTTSGRKAIGFVVESLAGDRCLNLPTLIECELPNNRDEIPSPRVATAYPHLKDIKDSIPAIINDAEIEILIGRDLISAHFVLDQRRGTGNAPYAQKLPLGWVVIGSVCLDTVHIPETVTACKTFVLGNGRTSHFEPCDKRLTVKENIFLKTDSDEKIAPSIEDNIFLKIMDRNLRKDDDGHWVSPLPFHPSRPSLPNNRSQALNRALSLDRSLHRSSTKKEHVSEFMNRIFEKGHAEKAPDIPDTKERWYLPMFGVYHPKKPEAIRMVFDSSARFNGIALNEVLLKGLDISNDLRGILLRFRRERIAMTADVEQMFHNFRVREDHRDYLRFLWHPMNDLNLPLEEFRMTVHVFGNRPSPAIATYGLRRSVDDADDDVKDFVNNDFYVDDALRSCPDVETAVDLMRRTQTALQDGGSLRLHKIASNSKSVLLQFPKEDLSKDLKDIDIGEDDLPMQRSLGLSWDINADVFTFKTSVELKPFTRRGILSTINSLYDPLGFTSPVTLQGKLLLRQMMSNSQNTGWDDPLDESFVQKWAAWVDSLRFLGTLRFPRMYSNMSVEKATRTEVHIFSDASKDAIAAVAFLKTWNETNCETSFLIGKAKVAPTHGHTIPRLELCSAVLGVEIGEIIREQMRLPSECFWFYTDSQVALGYIANEARRFYVYVANRVSRIRSFCGPEHWQHVPTDQNPADLATRNFEAKDLAESIWITGPSFLKRNVICEETLEHHEDFGKLLSDSDTNVRPIVIVDKVHSVASMSSMLTRFQHFSKWFDLMRSVAILQHVAASSRTPCEHSSSRWHYCRVDATSLQAARLMILKEVQIDAFKEEIRCLVADKSIAKGSNIAPLSPFLDESGLLRVGGRLSKAAGIASNSVQPIIIPKKGHVTTLLIRHYHESIFHQGRKLTEGKIRSAGLWIVGAKRLIASEIHHCVVCRKLRGSFCTPRMADLPADRLTPGPPFTFVGVDTFGPWEVIARRTRGGQAAHKRWAILFTCLVCRAIHIELIEELSTSAFINSLRRFISVRGPVREFRSDRGTNFVGAVNELKMLHHFVEQQSSQRFLQDQECVWLFNPPHASHFGGTWERMIGVVRNVLNGILCQTNTKSLTHETLSTFLSEVCAIVNSRPLTPLTEESDVVLSPNMILTQKGDTLPQAIPAMDPKEMYKSQWRHVQTMAAEFWKRWKRDYISSLQPRSKWTLNQRNLEEGDLVLVKELDTPRNLWPVAIVNKTFPSEDGCVRTVQIRMRKGDDRTLYIRPVHKLVPLLESSEKDNDDA